MKAEELTCMVGITNPRPSTVLTLANNDGTAWYVVEGGTIVNLSPYHLKSGTDIEQIPDIDCFTYPVPITDLDELIEAVES